MQAIHPYCGDRKVLKGYNDPRTTRPEIAREWNKERNGDLKPTARDRQLKQARLVEVQGGPRGGPAS